MLTILIQDFEVLLHIDEPPRIVVDATRKETSRRMECNPGYSVRLHITYRFYGSIAGNSE